MTCPGCTSIVNIHQHVAGGLGMTELTGARSFLALNGGCTDNGGECLQSTAPDVRVELQIDILPGNTVPYSVWVLEDTQNPTGLGDEWVCVANIPANTSPGENNLQTSIAEVNNCGKHEWAFILVGDQISTGKPAIGQRIDLTKQTKWTHYRMFLWHRAKAHPCG